MPDEISDVIQTEAVSAIKSATVDGRTVNGHDLTQLIEADRYLAEKAASAPSRTVLPIRTAKIVH